VNELNGKGRERKTERERREDSLSTADSPGLWVTRQLICEKLYRAE